MTTWVFQSAAGGLSYIEQLHTPTVCNRPTTVLKARSSSNHMVLYFKARCKCWNCRPCAEINAALWRYRAFVGLAEMQALDDSASFVTLTSHEALKTAKETEFVLQRAFPKLRTRISRKLGVWRYLAVPEHHADGRLHLHMLASGKLTKRWIKDNARASGFGYMAEWEILREPVTGMKYVTKYITGGLGEYQWRKGFHRVRTSRNWPTLPDFVAPGDWTLSKLGEDQPLMDDIAVELKLQMKAGLTDHATAWRIIDSLG